jgi:DNA-binding NtrC family response regulator
MIGKFEFANVGTLFLDEINALPLEIQTKLLRVLQQNEIMRLGDNQTIPVDVRLIAATNKDLFELVEQNEFREDLYYRLNVMEITIPPLRERYEDLQMLIDHFIQRLCADMCVQRPEISLEVMQILTSYHWPGNVRELENCIERAILLSEGQLVLPRHLPQRMLDKPADSAVGAPSLRRSFREIIEATIERTGGNMSQAARELKIARSTLYRKMEEFGISREA